MGVCACACIAGVVLLIVSPRVSIGMILTHFFDRLIANLSSLHSLRSLPLLDCVVIFLIVYPVSHLVVTSWPSSVGWIGGLISWSCECRLLSRLFPVFYI